MSTDAFQTCAQCGAALTAWEQEDCACTGPKWVINREVLYSIACNAKETLHARDFVRHAQMDHSVFLDNATAVATLAGDPRFCWAGKGIYGLYRHGPLPGPRNLEQAARIILVASGGPLTQDALDFCLKQFGYRYNLASLRNAVARSSHISWDRYGSWDHSRTEEAQMEMRLQIPIVPQRQRAAWINLREATANLIHTAIIDRDARLVSLTNPMRFGMSWEE